jgi:hypothetical protein
MFTYVSRGAANPGLPGLGAGSLYPFGLGDVSPLPLVLPGLASASLLALATVPAAIKVLMLLPLADPAVEAATSLLKPPGPPRDSPRPGRDRSSDSTITFRSLMLARCTLKCHCLGAWRLEEQAIRRGTKGKEKRDRTPSKAIHAARKGPRGPGVVNYARENLHLALRCAGVPLGKHQCSTASTLAVPLLLWLRALRGCGGGGGVTCLRLKPEPEGGNHWHWQAEWPRKGGGGCSLALGRKRKGARPGGKRNMLPPFFAAIKATARVLASWCQAATRTCPCSARRRRDYHVLYMVPGGVQPLQCERQQPAGHSRNAVAAAASGHGTEKL